MGKSAVAIDSFSLIVCRGRSLVARVWLIWVDCCGPIVPQSQFGRIYSIDRCIFVVIGQSL